MKESVQRLRAASPIAFGGLNPSVLPKSGGVYAIYRGDAVLYVGKTIKIRERVYRGHLVSERDNARLKRKLIAAGECSDWAAARDYLEKHCAVRWIESDLPLLQLESFVASELSPKYDRHSPNA